MGQRSSRQATTATPTTAPAWHILGGRQSVQLVHAMTGLPKAVARCVLQYAGMPSVLGRLQSLDKAEVPFRQWLYYVTSEHRLACLAADANESAGIPTLTVSEFDLSCPRTTSMDGNRTCAIECRPLLSVDLERIVINLKTLAECTRGWLELPPSELSPAVWPSHVGDSIRIPLVDGYSAWAFAAACGLVYRPGRIRGAEITITGVQRRNTLSTWIRRDPHPGWPWRVRVSVTRDVACRFSVSGKRRDVQGGYPHAAAGTYWMQFADLAGPHRDQFSARSVLSDQVIIR